MDGDFDGLVRFDCDDLTMMDYDEFTWMGISNFDYKIGKILPFLLFVLEYTIR